MLLLDEPLGALDLKLRKQMQIELKKLQEQVGITFVYVTHDQEEALTMSDRIAVMNEGRILQLGTPEEIYERPNCRFVADFIGETNVVPGVVQESDDAHTWVATTIGRFPPALTSDQRPRPGSTLPYDLRSSPFSQTGTLRGCCGVASSEWSTRASHRRYRFESAMTRSSKFGTRIVRGVETSSPISDQAQR